MTLLKISISLILLISTTTTTSANELGLSENQLNSLLSLETVQSKEKAKEKVVHQTSKLVPVETVNSKKANDQPKLKKVANKIIVTKSKRISCKSFNSQPQAQQHFDLKQKSWKALDRDKDGEACECLKGGSKYGESICKRWRKKAGKK